jgi:6-phosphofructokinase 2
MDKQAPLPIATLTLNPCLDVSYELSSLMPDQKVRANHTHLDPGGNGTNVERAFKELGLPAINCCILAAEISTLVERMLGVQLDNLQAIRMSGETRINCAILEKEPPVQYEMDGIGLNVGPETLEQFMRSFLEGAQEGIGVLTGSLPAGVPAEIYGDLVERLREIEMLCGRQPPSLSAVVEEGRRLQQQGVTYICVSLGGEGAILVGPQGGSIAKMYYRPPLVVSAQLSPLALDPLLMHFWKVRNCLHSKRRKSVIENEKTDGCITASHYEGEENHVCTH